MTTHCRIAIMGGGLARLATANALRTLSIWTTVFEFSNTRLIRMARVHGMQRLSLSDTDNMRDRNKQKETINRDRPGVTRELDWLWRFEVEFA